MRAAREKMFLSRVPSSFMHRMNCEDSPNTRITFISRDNNLSGSKWYFSGLSSFSETPSFPTNCSTSRGNDTASGLMVVSSSQISYTEDKPMHPRPTASQRPAAVAASRG